MTDNDNQPTGSLFERCVTRREMLLSSGGALAVILLVGCGGGEQQQQQQQQGNQPQEQRNVYFGWLLTATTDMAAVALEVGAAAQQETREIVAYVCNGLGPPDGMAVWFKGPVSEQTVQQLGAQVDLTSPGGQETLRIGYLTDREVRGTFTIAEGQTSRFIAYPAVDGAGIYEVTLDEDLNYSGISTTGDKLEGQADREGNVEGTITIAGGEKIEFFTQSMALASTANLNEQGLSTKYKQFAENNQVPGEYVAVVAPGGAHWFGRSGNVRGGSPGANIIGLDKSH
jgi:hypothetical protein